MGNDLELVKKILDGEEKAWHEFVETHTPYIRNIIAGYAGDRELAADLFTSLLEKLVTEKLSGFKGKSTLKTWLFIVTGNHCRDHFRSENGIRHVKKAAAGLCRLDRRFFELFYLDGLQFGEVIESLRLEMGKEITFLDLFEADRRVGAHMAGQKLGRLLDKLLACRRSPGRAAVIRGSAFHDPDLLESPKASPDSLSGSRDLQKVMELLREAVSLLSQRDRLLLKMRFEHGESARRIGELLGFRDVKQVYRKLDCLYGELASRLEANGMPVETCRYVVRDMDALFSLEEMWHDNRDLN